MRATASPTQPRELQAQPGREERAAPGTSAVAAARLWAGLPGVAGGVAFALYLRTLAPGIEFADAGELVTAATRLWVPHPSGYPLFLLVGHLFSRLPIGSEEFVRLNLMSAVFCALGVAVFGYWLKLVLDLAHSAADASAQRIEKELDHRRKRGKRKRSRDQDRPPVIADRPGRLSEPVLWTVAALGALLLATARPFWSLATAAEVYPIYIFLLGSNLYLFTRYMVESDARRQFRIGLLWAFVVGLSFTSHLSTSLLAPAFLLAFFLRYRTRNQVLPRLLSFAGPFVLGLVPLLLLPVLAVVESPPDWLYPLTVGRLFEHVSGARYHAWFLNAEGFGRNLPIFLQLPGQFGYLGFILALIGAAWAVVRAARLFFFTGVVFVTAFLYAVTYKSVEIEPFFLHCYLVTAVWGAFGALAILERFRHVPAHLLLGLLVPVVLAASLAVNFRENDRSQNRMPEDLLANMLGDALPNAIVFSNDFFRFQSPLMYLQHVRGVRPDVDGVTVALLSEPFYLRSLEKNQPELYTPEMLAARQGLGSRRLTKEGYQKEQIGFIVSRLYERRPIYFENSVPHEVVPDGFEVMPQGLLYRVLRKGDSAGPPPPPKAYPFRDVGYVDYNVDKARNNYATMMYANGLQAERTGARERARQYFRYALTFVPAAPDRISRDDEGRALLARKQEIEAALARGR